MRRSVDNLAMAVDYREWQRRSRRRPREGKKRSAHKRGYLGKKISWRLGWNHRRRISWIWLYMGVVSESGRWTNGLDGVDEADFDRVNRITVNTKEKLFVSLTDRVRILNSFNENRTDSRKESFGWLSERSIIDPWLKWSSDTDLLLCNLAREWEVLTDWLVDDVGRRNRERLRTERYVTM